MEHTATRDENNPHWNDLLDHVQKLNDQLVALANFHLGNNVKAQLTDDEEMRRATDSIADACLEVVDATCVTVATMRSITAKHNLETKRSTMKAGSDLPLIDNKKTHHTNPWEDEQNQASLDNNGGCIVAVKVQKQRRNSPCA